MIYRNRQSIERECARKYPRVDFFESLRFKSYSLTSDRVEYHEDFFSEGISMNISPGGLLFKTEHAPPRLDSVLWMALDMKTIRTITLPLDTDQKPLIFENGLLGKVIHMEENPDKDARNVGISFITKFDASLP